MCIPFVLIDNIKCVNSSHGRSLSDRGGAYSYIHVLSHYFLMKSIVFTFCKHEYTNVCPLPTLDDLVRALCGTQSNAFQKSRNTTSLE